jgi:N-acyl-D-aspartate/D-glutamate deacylase
VARWYSDREGKVKINFGGSVGYLQVRHEVMDVPLVYERKAPEPSDEQLAEILRRIQRGFDEGAVALGMGNSAQPDPTGWEHVEAFRVAAEVGAHVVATLRDDNWSEYGPESNVPANLAQMIGSAAPSGAAVNIPHFTSSAAGHTPRLLQMIARAQAHGLAITAEDSPYIEGVIRIGPGDMDGWSDREIHEIQPMDADERLTRESYERYRDRAFTAIAHNDLAAVRAKHSVAQALASPHVSIASHGSGSVWTARDRGHPRTSGTFGRVLGYYVREQRLLTLMDALRKMTLMPAQRFERRVPAMRNKGRIREGADADIVVFDADRIVDRATFQEQRPSEGVRYVLVNGIPVVRDGVIQKGIFAGRPIRGGHGNVAEY